METHFIIPVLLPFFHTKALVRRYQQLTYSIKTYSVHLPFLTHTLSCFLSHTPSMSFYTSLPCITYHLQISALRNPIISLLTFHMPKPSQPATPNNSIHTHNTQPTPELLTRSSVLQSHSRHPPNHAIFHSHKLLHIIHFHRPSFATIHKHPLYTHSVYLFLHF